VTRHGNEKVTITRGNETAFAWTRYELTLHIQTYGRVNVNGLRNVSDDMDRNHAVSDT